MARSRRPRLLEVCPFEWEALVRRKGTSDGPSVMMLSRDAGVWFVYVDRTRSTKTFVNKAEAFDYANTEYEDAR